MKRQRTMVNSTWLIIIELQKLCLATEKINKKVTALWGLRKIILPCILERKPNWNLPYRLFSTMDP